MNLIYLAGGMKSGWQEIVKERIKGKDFYTFDPRNHQLENPEQYTIWDLYHVKNCDIVFAYIEQDNPSGYGAALEIGYAKALGKTIILVDEKSISDESFKRQYELIRKTADIVFYSLEEGIQFLESFDR